tara:strand:- start:83 stop:778 length:696 start_codon:yes stop_codon:yes gene_type:complete
MIPFGTLFNVAAVILGGSLGLLFKKIISNELNKKVFFVMGLFTIVLGMSIAIESTNFMLMFLSIVIGTLIGEDLNIDQAIINITSKIKTKIKVKDEKFTDGLITALLLFCSGSMTIVGSIDEGLGKAPDILYTKAVMDGVSSIILASTFGVGVLFSVFPMFIFQGGITILAFYYRDFLPLELIDHISTVGGVLIIAIGFKILGYKKINPTNMLPALLVLIFLFLIKDQLGI